MRFLRRALLVSLVLVALAVVGLFLFLDAALRASVEKAGSSALGVPTHLERAALSPFDGEVTLGGLVIENPPGYDEKPFLALERAHAKADLSSLGSEVVRVELVELESVALLLQKRAGRANYKVILEHLGSGKEREPQAPEDESAGVRQHIERLVIRDIRVDFDLLPLGGEITRAEVRIPEIVLNDLGNSGNGAGMGEITARVVEALLQAALQAGAKVLSPELLVDLKDGLAGLGVGVIELGEGVIGGIGGALEGIGGGAADALKGLGDVLTGRKKDGE